MELSSLTSAALQTPVLKAETLFLRRILLGLVSIASVAASVSITLMLLQ